MKVSVGSGVSEGGVVGLCVGKKIGVMVGYGVSEGGGGDVEVGNSVGVGEMMRLNPPHPRIRRANAEMKTKNLLITDSGQRFDFAWLALAPLSAEDAL